MESFWFCFLLVGFLAVGGAPSHAELIAAVSDVVEKIGEDGRIEWSNAVVMALGMGVRPADADSIRSEAAKLSFLEKCRVIIVVDWRALGKGLPTIEGRCCV